MFHESYVLSIAAGMAGAPRFMTIGLIAYLGAIDLLFLPKCLDVRLTGPTLVIVLFEGLRSIWFVTTLAGELY